MRRLGKVFDTEGKSKFKGLRWEQLGMWRAEKAVDQSLAEKESGVSGEVGESTVVRAPVLWAPALVSLIEVQCTALNEWVTWFGIPFTHILAVVQRINYKQEKWKL